MSKKDKGSENYLERIPAPADTIKWEVSEDGKVTLHIENTGFFNKVAQKFFKRPKVSFVHLDDNGSFVWQLMDAKRDILELGRQVSEKVLNETGVKLEMEVKYIG